jgi:hypothetical protein
VLGETSPPRVTAPPTDTIGATGSDAGTDVWRIVLIVLAAFTAGALVLTQPQTARRKD